jgi:hypothetical protein
MDVSIAEAKNRLPELIRAVEDGEKVGSRKRLSRTWNWLPPTPLSPNMHRRACAS